MTSTIKVNNIQNQCGANIINENSDTITIGASGDTIALASGASQTGFGRTGTVDWQTSIKTAASFTAANGEGYFVDTSSNAVTANLPAGTSGSIVAFRDYANNFDTNNLTIAPNGSQKIDGDASIDLKVSTEGESLTLVYADDTKGWLVVNDGNNDAGKQEAFITATGGTITTVCTNFKVHTFTGPGTFCVSAAGNSCGSNSVDYMVVAGGAAGANAKDGTNGNAGGGGAGGYRESPGSVTSYTASPLGASPAAAITVTAQGYPIVVGAGGASSSTDDSAPGPGSGNPGNVSSGLGISSAGGGGGGRSSGDHGGSGGGASDQGTPGNGNTPPVSPPQGNNGGASTGSGACTVAAGGGGAGAVGANANSGGPAGNGGAGVASSINGTPTTRAGGGGGGGNSGQTGGGTGGSGGGGAGGTYNGGSGSGVNGTAGTANTGGGGGATASACGATPVTSGAGGSGIVIIRYKFQ